MRNGYDVIHATYYSATASGIDMDIDDWEGQQEINAYQTYLDDTKTTKQLKAAIKLKHREKNIARSLAQREESLRKKALKKLTKENKDD